MLVSPLLRLLLLLPLPLPLLMIAVHADLHSDAIKCIFASTHQTALERWIHCLPSPQFPLTEPSQNPGLVPALPLPPPVTPALTSLPCETPSSQPPSDICERESLHDAILGAPDAGWDRGHAAWCSDMEFDKIPDEIGDACTPLHESSEFRSPQVILSTDTSSFSPAADSDGIDLVGAGEAICENQLDEGNRCGVGKGREIATDRLPCGDQGTQSVDNREIGGYLLEVNDEVVVGDAKGIVPVDGRAAANFPDDSTDVSQAKVEAIERKRAMDCDVENSCKGGQGDAFPAVLRLNVASALLVILITNYWRRHSRNESRRRKRSKNKLQWDVRTVRELPNSSCRPTAEVDRTKSLAVNLRPEILGAPLGTAVGAVFAEVLLNKCCSCKTSVPANELWPLLEAAMRESLKPVVGVGSLVEDFVASFQSSYRTICTVHQACSRNSTDLRQNVVETAHVGPMNECSKSANVRRVSEKPDGKLEMLNAEVSQQLNYAKNTDTRKNDLQDLCKDVHDVKQEDCHCRSCEFLRKDENITREPQPGFCTLMDVSGKTETRNSLADSSQLWLSERNNNSIGRGECSTEDSAVEDGCMLLWDGLLTASEGHLITKNTLKLPAQVFPKSTSNENNSSSHPLPCAHQDYYTELPDNLQDSLSLQDSGDEAGHLDRNMASSSLAELSSEDKVAGIDSQSNDKEAAVQEHSDTSQPADGLLNAVVLASQSHQLPQAGWQKAFLHVFEKSVQAQERHNYFKSVELAHLFRQHTIGEQQLQLASLSNDLMKEHIDLSRSKASFKRSTVLERRLNAAYVEFSKTCADELVAGLFVMLLSLACSIRRYSSAILFDLVSTCQFPVKEPHRSSWLYIDWFYNSLDSMAGQLKAFVCHVTIAGRILFGSSVVAVVSYLLLRQSVTSSSQSMSAVIIIIVLGVICGFAGKVSVDSLGGNGLHWLFMWEMLCTIHALATCFTPFIYKIVDGSLSSEKPKFRIPLFPTKFIFHFAIVLVLPILAGQLPFCSLSTVLNDFLSLLSDTVPSIIFSWWGSMGHVI